VSGVPASAGTRVQTRTQSYSRGETHDIAFARSSARPSRLRRHARGFRRAGPGHAHLGVGNRQRCQSLQPDRPCKTFAGAISKTFINGEIDHLDPNGAGAVTITKSITLDGTTGAGFASILASGTNGIVINIPAGNANDPLRTVRIRNVNINGTGASGAIGKQTGINGIKILSAGTVYIENVVISDFTNRGISDERNGAGRLFITNTVVRNNVQSGIAVVPIAGAVTAMLDNVIVEGNGNAGIAVSGGSKATARNATAAGNFIGFYADTAGTEFNLEGCVSHANGTGVNTNPPGTPTIRLSNCVITNNTTNGLLIAAGAVQSFLNNKLAGNTGVQSGMAAANPGQQ
jgi:hypothetical protein